MLHGAVLLAGAAPARAAAQTAPTSPLRVEIGGGALTRSWVFQPRRRVTDNQPEFTLSPAPLAFGSIEYYPIAQFDSRPEPQIGMVGSYQQYALFTKTEDITGSKVLYAISSRQWFVGTRARLFADQHQFGMVTGVGSHSFRIVKPAPTVFLPQRREVPNVDWRYWRIGLDARLRFDRVLMGASLGYRIVTDSGAFANAAGADGDLSMGYVIWHKVELRVGASLVRYALAEQPFASKDGIDLYFSGWGALSWEL